MINSTIKGKVFLTFLAAVLFFVSGTALQSQEVVSIMRDTPTNQHTNSSTLTWEVVFDANIEVSSFTTSDLTLFTVSGNVAGVVNSVSGTGDTYTVEVNSITDEGDLRLDFTGTVTDLNNTDSKNTYTSGEIYTVDVTAPTVVSIVRNSPVSTQTNASIISWIVTFSEDVSGSISIGDFTKNGTPTGGITSVTMNSPTEYVVEMSNIEGNGTLTIDFTGTAVDLAGNNSTTTFTNGQTYTVDNISAQVSSIIRNSPSSPNTNNSSVRWRVDFTEGVMPGSVETTDFTLSGTPTGTISSVSGSGSTYYVTVTGITGEGTLSLNFTGSVFDDAGNMDTDAFSEGETYTIDITAPTVTSIDRNTPSQQLTNSNTLVFTVEFSEDLNEGTISAGDFTLVNTSGSVSGFPSSIEGSGDTYNVTVAGVNGDGDVRLDYTGLVQDLANNSGTMDFTTGETYTIDQTAPRVSDFQSSIYSFWSSPTLGSIVTLDLLYNTTTGDNELTVGSLNMQGRNLDTDEVPNIMDNSPWSQSIQLTKEETPGELFAVIRVVDAAGNSTVFRIDNEGQMFSKPQIDIFVIDQPVDVVECVNSTDRFFSVISAPSDKFYPLAYRWYKDGNPVSAARVQNGLLPLDTLEYNMSGLYTVEIWAIDTTIDSPDPYMQRHTPSVWSTPANLYVLQQPEFMKDIMSVTAAEGSNLEFTIDAHTYGEHNMEDPSYWTQIDWYRGDVELEDNDRYEGTDASILTIENVQLDDYANDYRCRLIGECDTVWSNTFAISAEPVPTVTVQPISVDGCVDDVVQITVEATSSVQSVNLNFQWMVNGMPIANEAGKFSGANTPNLNVTLTTDHGYDGTEEYTCMIYPEGFPSNTVTSNPAMITWKTAPMITTDLDAAYSVAEEKDITMTIAVDGENLTYTWMKDGNDLNNNMDSYEITAATANDAGEYMVTVTNDCGEVMSTTATLTVTPKTVTTSVTADNGLGLEQNYPNPVVDNSTIKFTSEISGQATLTMTDMMGNTVANIFNGNVNANKTVIANINSNELNLTSGAYFVTLRIGDRVETIQISVIK